MKHVKYYNKVFLLFLSQFTKLKKKKAYRHSEIMNVSTIVVKTLHCALVRPFSLLFLFLCNFIFPCGIQGVAEK